jgi:hypothetical protein
MTGQTLSSRMLMYLSAFISPSTIAVVADACPHHDTAFAVRIPLHQVRSPLFLHTYCNKRTAYNNPWCVLLSKWLWIMVSFIVPVVVNEGVLCWAEWLCIVMYYAGQSGYESWCAMLIPMVGNQGVSCRTSGCESWFVILSQWLWIMVCYAEPVFMYYGVLCWASGCESWCIILSQWLWIMVCYGKPSGCES